MNWTRWYSWFNGLSIGVISVFLLWAIWDGRVLSIVLLWGLLNFRIFMLTRKSSFELPPHAQEFERRVKASWLDAKGMSTETRVTLEIIIAEIRGCATLDDVLHLMDTWVTGNDLHPERVVKVGDFRVRKVDEDKEGVA